VSPLNRTIGRREALGILGGTGLLAVVGCGPLPTGPTSGSSPAKTSSGDGSSGNNLPSTAKCATTPDEGVGVHPDELGLINDPSYFRQDITDGKTGVPLTLALTVVSVKSGCAAVSGAQVQVSQCDSAGNYSEYAQTGVDVRSQRFLRGAQTTDANGSVTFRSIYPGWYGDRAAHVHVDIFINGSVVKSTQLAFPDEISATVNRLGDYALRGQNPMTNARDYVFGDSLASELATVTGDSATGYLAALTIVV
jgi:protocatechuate 3,4-dioxygenase beta subunit